MIVIVFLATVLIVFTIQWYLKRKEFYKFSDNIPSAKNYGILGHGPHFLGKNDEGRFQLLHELCLKYKDMIKLWIGPAILWVLINEPKFIQKVLLSPVCLEKPFFYKFLRLDAGLISSKYDIWKIHRKSLNYSFNLKILQTFIPTFVESSQKLISDLKQEIGKTNEFNILDYTTKTALNMICGTSFGVDIKNVTLGDDVFHALEKLNRAISARSQNVVLYSEPIYRMSHYYRQEMESRKVCYSSADVIIKLKRQTILNQDSEVYGATEEDLYKEATKNFPELLSLDKAEVLERIKEITVSQEKQQNPLNDEDIPNRKIFIDHVLCSDAKFNDSEVRDHVYTIVAAGSETTALQTAHTILLLATHPEIQELAHAELKEVFYSESVEMSYDNIVKLDYLERVIKESLRLCPVVPVIGRETQAPVQIGDIDFPAGITLLINFYTLHRRQDIWGPDAEEFNPDHFLPESIEKRHPYSFLPFSGGQRNCIGYRYAMIALKILLAHLIMNYKFTTSFKYKDLRFRTDINLKLCTPHLVKLEPRN